MVFGSNAISISLECLWYLARMLIVFDPNAYSSGKVPTRMELWPPRLGA